MAGLGRWQERSACLDMDPKLFHELAWDPETETRLPGFYAAQAVCWSCPVRSECLEYARAFVDPDAEGVYAGRDPNELRRMNGKRAANNPNTEHRTRVYLIHREDATVTLMRPGGQTAAAAIRSARELHRIVLREELEVARP